MCRTSMMENTISGESYRVTVVIPTYNEREGIASLVGEIRHVLSGEDVEGHVLVVDDSSPDGTGQIVAQISSQDPFVHLIERPSKLGLGSAYLQGFKWLLTSIDPHIVVEMDADFSHPPDLLPVMIRIILDGADVVVASRYVSGGGSKSWPLRRRIVSKGANFLARVLLGMGVNDATSGYRAMSSRAVVALTKEELKNMGYAFQVESLFVLKAKGFTIVEVPFIFTERKHGRTKLGGGEILGFANLVLSLAVRRLLRKTHIKGSQRPET